MNFSIPVRNLKEAVPELRKLAARKSSLPVLSTVLIERDKGATRLTATDLDARLTYTIPPDLPEPASDLGKKLQQNRSAREDGALCVPIKDLATAVKNADANGDVVFAPKELTYTFNGNKATLGGFEIEAVEFPAPFCKEYGAEYPLTDAVRDSILAALPCVGTDETRYVLIGVYFESKLSSADSEFGNKIVATDGKSLVYFDVPLPQLGNFIMPTNALSLCTGRISKHPWTISVSDHKFDTGDAGPSAFTIKAGPWTLESRTVEGNYPNWRQVVPTKDDKAAELYYLNTFNRLTIADGLERLPKTSNSEHDPVLVGVGAGDQMKFSVDTQNSFSVTLHHGVGNKPRCVQANRAFWQRLVDFGSTEIRIQDEVSPVVGYRNGAAKMTYVFMPVRISS